MAIHQKKSKPAVTIPDYKYILLRVDNSEFLQKIADKVVVLTISEQALVVDEVNLLGHSNFIAVCITGLPPDDPTRPGYAEIKDIAKKLASDLSKLTDHKLNADGIIPMAKVTDVYAEFIKLDFEDKK
jgi:hypothetical protein